MKTSFVLIGALGFLWIAPAAAQERTEISPDGLESTTNLRLTGTGSAGIMSDSVPFGLAPDWNCNLRMQVGGLCLGDLDGDNDSDLAVACYRSNSYPPYPDWRDFALYNQAGQFQSTPGWWTRDSISSTEVRIADFNNDGHADIFAGNGSSSLPPDAIYFGTTGDTLRTTPGWRATNSTWTTGVAVCDFDHDGDIDVATSNQGLSPNAYRPVSMFRNNNGTLEQSPSWTSVASEISSALAWGDINNDGFEDLAVSKWVNFQSCVYLNDSGTVGRTPYWTGNTTQGQKGIGWADLNGDTLSDLAIGGSIPTQAYLNTGGTLGANPVWSPQNAYHGTQDLAWGDVDGDGDPDLATAEFSTGQFRIYLNRNGQLDQTPSWQYDSPNAGTALAFGDVNGDGRADFVIGVSGQPCVSVFYNTLTTAVEEATTPVHEGLLTSYPNPFNGETTLGYRVPGTGGSRRVVLSVYDVLGREVAHLFDDWKHPGSYSAVFRADHLPSGVYFARLATGQTETTTKLLLMK
jgi:hypothetical protein